jgi:riboflavin synthase
MFTGIVLGQGTTHSVTPKGGDVELGIAINSVAARHSAVGASISVQGVCLTVTRWEGEVFFADLSRETLSKSTLGDLRPGSSVNLEPALRAGDALGGHLVSGHIDGRAQLLASAADARSQRLRWRAPAALMRFIATKGSVALDGVSLTVNSVSAEEFAVNLIPHTLQVTTLGALTIGAQVNLEIDLIARYTARLLESSPGGTH